MKPSFATLYHRSRYLRSHVPTNDESPENRAERAERERYAVAALGFCFLHDPSFRRHFLGHVLNLPYDGQAPTEVILEKGDVDLIISFSTPEGEHVIAIEAKLGAGLDCHQNPAEEHFWQPRDKNQSNGYGLTITTLHPEATRVDFVVLGHPKELHSLPPAKVLKAQWHFHQLGWGDLDLPTGQQPNSLTQDFFDTLAYFHVPAFAMKHTEKITLSGNLRDAVLAQLVLRHVGQTFGLTDKLIPPYTDIVDDKNWFLGVNIVQRQPNEEKSGTGSKRRSKGDQLGNIVELTRLVRPETGPKQPLGWFGYEGDGSKTVLSVYLYCGSPAVADTVKRKIPATLQPKIQADGGIIITKPDSDNRPDRQWFTGVFKALGLKQAR